MATLAPARLAAEQCICDVGVLLAVICFVLHVGRPYVERVRSRRTLRAPRPLWWLAYVVLRDGTLFAAVVVGLWGLSLDRMAQIQIALPFVPFGTVALAAALVVKVHGQVQDAKRCYRRVACLVLAGAVLEVLGYVLVLKAPDVQLATAGSSFWMTMWSWRSNVNLPLAVAVFFAAWTMLVALAIPVMVRAVALVSRARGRRAHSAEEEERDTAAWDPAWDPGCVSLPPPQRLRRATAPGPFCATSQALGSSRHQPRTLR